MKRARVPGFGSLVGVALLVSQLVACGLAKRQSPQPLRHLSNSPRSTHTAPFEDESEPVGNDTGPSYNYSPSGAVPPGCHLGDPRAGVNTPIRLIVRDPCLTVHGLVGCVYTDRVDGDTHLALLLDAGDTEYLTPGNNAWTCGSDQGSDTAPRMVVEIIPQHCTVRPDNCADRGHFVSPPIPANGQHITVTGAWVQDTSRKQGATLWSEIHPAFRIVVDG